MKARRHAGILAPVGLHEALRRFASARSSHRLPFHACAAMRNGFRLRACILGALPRFPLDGA